MRSSTEYGGLCCEEVSRGGWAQPCDKTAVAVRRHPEHGDYAVCAYHARFDMVPLAELLASVLGGA